MNDMYIGFYFRVDKKQELFNEELLNKMKILAQKQNININFIDIDENNYNKYNYDKIITKLDEIYIDNIVNNTIINFLMDNISVKDPIKYQYDIGNRLIMADKLQEICIRMKNLYIPEYIYLEPGSEPFIIPKPVICKPIKCFGVNYAHDMCIINSNINIKKYINKPSLIQNYYDHDSIIFKIYVINQKYNIVIKNSISFDNSEIQYFNTGNIKKQSLNIDSQTINNLIRNLSIDIDIPYLNMLINLHFGLSLFGYDIIKTGNKYAIIDVNYLPGYKNMHNYQDYMTDYILNC